MKRYTDKQLKAMTPEELETVKQQAIEECQKASQKLEESLAKNPSENPIYYFPFGQKVHPLVQKDTSPKKVFVLGVYASAVHAKWRRNGQVICRSLTVASEPRIFWDGDPNEAKQIIDAVAIPPELGTLEPAYRQLNGPSAKVLDENILAPLGFTRADVWLCDCLPETRINPNQVKVINKHYNPLIEQYGLNPVTVPKRSSAFCDKKEVSKLPMN